MKLVLFPSSDDSINYNVNLRINLNHLNHKLRLKIEISLINFSLENYTSVIS